MIKRRHHENAEIIVMFTHLYPSHQPSVLLYLMPHLSRHSCAPRANAFGILVLEVLVGRAEVLKNCQAIDGGECKVEFVQLRLAVRRIRPACRRAVVTVGVVGGTDGEGRQGACGSQEKEEGVEVGDVHVQDIRTDIRLTTGLMLLPSEQDSLRWS